MTRKLRRTAKQTHTRTRAVSSRGASRDGKYQGASRIGISVVLKSLAVVFVGALITTSVWGAKEFIANASERPINAIAVEGEFNYLKEEQISAAVAPMIRDGFLTLPLAEVKKELERNPWVESAAVSRRWPDKLFISIAEQQPIARWGANGFLNYQGQVVRVPAHDALKNLPLLSGNPGQEREVMHNYQQLGQLLRPFGLNIVEFYCDELYSWQVVLSNGLVIKIGRNHVMEKVERFLTVYSRALREEIQRIDSIDLRYGNGVAVKWRSDSVDDMQPELASPSVKENKRA